MLKPAYLRGRVRHVQHHQHGGRGGRQGVAVADAVIVEIDELGAANLARPAVAEIEARVDFLAGDGHLVRARRGRRDLLESRGQRLTHRVLIGRQPGEAVRACLIHVGRVRIVVPQEGQRLAGVEAGRCRPCPGRSARRRGRRAGPRRCQSRGRQ